MSIEQDFFAFMSAEFPTIPIAYPGVRFRPPDEGQWLELNVFRAQPLDGTPASFAPKLSGELQVVICDRPGNGVLGHIATFDMIAAAMPSGTEFSNGLRTAQHPFMLSFITEDDRVMLPVSARFST